MHAERTTGHKKSKHKGEAPRKPRAETQPIAGAREPGHLAVPIRGTHAAPGARRLSNGVGLVSVGLGLVGLFAPATIGRLLGARACPSTRLAIRAAAFGHLATGIGVLSNRRTAPWLWARVAGDVVNLAVLTTRLGSRPPARGAILAGAGLATLSALAAKRANKVSAGAAASIHLNASVTILRTPQEVYAAWRNLQNLPRFMTHLESVSEQDGTIHLRARLPAGLHLEWDARVCEDLPNEKIAWASLDGSTISNRGAVTFSAAPGDRGTQLHLSLTYEPLGGAIGHALMKLFEGLTLEQVRGDLRRLKQILELGHLVHSDASLHKGPHPARPATDSQELADQALLGGLT